MKSRIKYNLDFVCTTACTWQVSTHTHVRHYISSEEELDTAVESTVIPYLEGITKLDNEGMNHFCKNVTLCLHIVTMIPLHDLVLPHHLHGIDFSSSLLLNLENFPKCPLTHHPETFKILRPQLVHPFTLWGFLYIIIELFNTPLTSTVTRVTEGKIHNLENGQLITLLIGRRKWHLNFLFWDRHMLRIIPDRFTLWPGKNGPWRGTDKRVWSTVDHWWISGSILNLSTRCKRDRQRYWPKHIREIKLFWDVLCWRSILCLQK